MTVELQPGARIAVIGSGVAGIVAAFLLQERYRVTLYEANARLGGHTNTVVLPDGPDSGTAVDTGFIVLNDRTYPLFHKFLARLQVSVRPSDMSFAYESRLSGFHYAGTDLNGLFADRRNIVSPKFYSFLREMRRFCSDGQEFLRSENPPEEVTLDQFLQRGGYSQLMLESYLLPMAASIWSAPFAEVLKFPVQSILQFFSNHGLLSLKDRPQWQTVVGGSHQYLKSFEASFSGTIRLGSAVTGINSAGGKSEVTTAANESESYEAVILAAHADQTLRMIGEPDSLERELLGVWRYQSNHTFLHTDISHLPRNRRAWASWNYIRETGNSDQSNVVVTYHMNRLQGLRTKKDYCVTLNPIRPPCDQDVVAEFIYEHPIFDSNSVRTQSQLHQLQGRNGRYFCGSYFGYGFHEDAVRSAVQVAEHFKVSL